MNTSPPWMRALGASFPQIASPFLPYSQTSLPLLKPLSRHEHPSLTQAPIHKHKDSFQSTHNHRSPPQASRLVPVNYQASTYNHKFATMLSLSLLVCQCVGVFIFLLILWSYFWFILWSYFSSSSY
ncbi:hypothetical protein ACJW30_10G126600 [Castanea mollissima]